MRNTFDGTRPTEVRVFDEDAFTAPAFLIPHVAFQPYMELPVFPCQGESDWRQYPAVPILFPGTGLQMRLVRLVDERSTCRRDFLSFVVQGTDSWVTACQAERVSNAVLAVLATAQHTFVDPREYAPVPVPESMWPAHTLDVNALLETLVLQLPEDPYFNELHRAKRSILERSQNGLDWVQATDAIVRFFEHGSLLRAAMYFAASIGVYCFLGDDVSRARGDRDEAPDTLLKQADAETAIWLAYKAVESVLGHLPADPRKLEQRLVLEGFSDFEAGWRGEPAIVLAEKLVSFTWDRDKRVGHGSMNPHRRQPITYFEVMDYQYLACALIEHRLFG
jgi:hypothetical protein